MKRLFSEINIDKEDERIMNQRNKRRRLNSIQETNDIFQDTFNVSFDLRPMLSDFLDINIKDEMYCIYCNEVNLYDDSTECSKCNKLVCHDCEKKWWNKLIDYRTDMIIDCCPTCIKKYKCCDICKNHYKTYSETLDNKKCKECKKYICRVCMPKRFKKVEIIQHNVHVGGGSYQTFNHVSSSSGKMYCVNCFLVNYEKYEDDQFKIIKL